MCVQASVSGKGTSGASAANGSSGGSGNANNHVTSVASDDDDDAFLTRAAHMAAQRKQSKR
jgi:hypothetical protein